ncbi:MAG TPA: multicopper oxidase domain-containing protein [Micromonosporaceae bacterium]|nr:multicopper oxidase domain-containing protein [Micromonosporaceae bacterium]
MREIPRVPHRRRPDVTWLRRFVVLSTATLVGGVCYATTPAAAAPPVPRYGMICTNGPTFNLTANTGYVETPDGNSVLMWSYSPTGGHFQSPGPVMCVAQGQTVTVNLHNTLPEPVSVIFPGQEGVVASGGSAGMFTREAATGGDVSYTFTAGQPGTYIYESGSDPSKQIEMGLYGALVVRPSGTPDRAYPASYTQFDTGREFLLLLADIDPDLHYAVETGGTYDINALHNRYFTINGRAFPDTIQDNGVSWLANQPYGALVRVKPYNATSNPMPALIRMANVGALNHPFHPHGNHLIMVAQDGRLLQSPSGSDASTQHFGDTIGAGQTEDFLFKWTDQDSWDATSNPFPSSVATPDWKNLTFKDNDTWFSGSPYLGTKGTLPTTVASQNVCGEWYFPWHSHALNEFSNFDEGFGGMGTLLRVDPLGGCTALASSTKILAGTLKSGTATNLGAQDTLFYQVNSTTSGTRTADWYAGFKGVAIGSTTLTVTYNGRNCGTGTAACPSLGATPVSTSIQIWNWTTSTWTNLATANIGTAGATLTGSPATVTPYIGTGANSGQVRVRVRSTRPSPNFVTQGNLLRITYDAP